MKKGKPSQKGNGTSRSKFLTRMLVRLGGEGEWWNREKIWDSLNKISSP